MNEGVKGWGKSYIVELLALVITILTLLATFTVPEIRIFFGLEEEVPKQNLQTVQNPKPENEKNPPEASVPASPTRLTLHENQPQFVAKAQISLSVVFNDVFGEKVASLTIAPDGKNSSTHAVLEGYTQEFTSSVGAFLVQILHVDYEGKNIEIQVTKNKEFSSDDKESSN